MREALYEMGIYRRKAMTEVQDSTVWALIVLALLVTMILCGCQESQQQKVWGKGDPDQAWQDYFGNDNMARLNFMQTARINAIAEIVTETAEVVTETAERLKALEATAVVDLRIKPVSGDSIVVEPQPK